MSSLVSKVSRRTQVKYYQLQFNLLDCLRKDYFPITFGMDLEFRIRVSY